jgi:hypothetical protein
MIITNNLLHRSSQNLTSLKKIRPDINSAIDELAKKNITFTDICKATKLKKKKLTKITTTQQRISKNILQILKIFFRSNLSAETIEKLENLFFSKKKSSPVERDSKTSDITYNISVPQTAIQLDVYRNNLKNQFLTASAFPQNFDSHSRLASRQWSLAPNQNSEEPPCQNSNSSSYFGITDPDSVLSMDLDKLEKFASRILRDAQIPLTKKELPVQTGPEASSNEKQERKRKIIDDPSSKQKKQKHSINFLLKSLPLSTSVPETSQSEQGWNSSNKQAIFENQNQKPSSSHIHSGSKHSQSFELLFASTPYYNSAAAIIEQMKRKENKEEEINCNAEDFVNNFIETSGDWQCCF